MGLLAVTGGIRVWYFWKVPRRTVVYYIHSVCTIYYCCICDQNAIYTISNGTDDTCSLNVVSMRPSSAGGSSDYVYK